MNKEQLLNTLKNLDFPIGDYYLLSSGCLMLYDMRDMISDIDLCISDELFEQIKDKYKLTENKKNECGFYRVNDELEIVVNKKEDVTSSYEIKDGIPVEKLTSILAYKINRNKEKDQKDIVNIKKYLETNQNHA